MLNYRRTLRFTCIFEGIRDIFIENSLQAWRDHIPRKFLFRHVLLTSFIYKHFITFHISATQPNKSQTNFTTNSENRNKYIFPKLKIYRRSLRYWIFPSNSVTNGAYGVTEFYGLDIVETYARTLKLKSELKLTFWPVQRIRKK